MTPEEIAQNRAIDKARNLRFRKPIVEDLNLDTIRDNLYDMQSACAEVHWFVDSEDGEDTLINKLDGDESEAYEFKAAFAQLESDAEDMSRALEEEWVPECFDEFFVAVRADKRGDYGGMLGFDEYYGDFYGIAGYSTDAAEMVVKERLMRMTKKEILEAAVQCFNVWAQYMSLKTRYDNLSAAIDILRGENKALLQMVKEIDELYEKAEQCEFASWDENTKRFNRLLNELPERAWFE